MARVSTRRVIGHVSLLLLWNWRGTIQSGGENEREVTMPKVVVSELVRVTVMVLLCAGDIETNPGPQDSLDFIYLLSLLEKVVALMRDIFGGDKRQSYLSAAKT